MSVGEVILRLVMGVVIGFCIGLTGIGGGVLVLPSLTLILKLPPSVAVGTASLYAFLTKVLATYHHFKLKTIDWGLSLWILAGAIPANIVCSVLINRYVKGAAGSEALATFQNSLRIFIGVVVCLCALVIIYRLLTNTRRTPRETEEKPDFAARLERHPPRRRILAIAAGALVGGLIGATSVGGGVVIVPILIIVFGLASCDTVGTSIFVAVVLTFLTAVIYSKGGQMEFATALVMALGSLVGVSIGSRLSVKIPEKPLQWVLSGVILLSAILMLFKGGH